MTEKIRPEWAKLLLQAVIEPGIVHRAYSLFHGYSLGNSFWVLGQMLERGIEPGPVASFLSWKKQGRCVKKGEKALAMYMPVTVKDKAEDADKDAGAGKDGDGKDKLRRFFIARKHWFALSQTEPIEGADAAPTEEPEASAFDVDAAIKGLGLTRMSFEMSNGNVMGYSYPRDGKLAISPLAFDPLKTACHEMAHCLLHGTKDDAGMLDCGDLSKSLKEVEAEAVAMLVCASIGCDAHLDACRGYIQTWLGRSGENVIPDANAQRIFSAASKILKAGTAEV